MRNDEAGIFDGADFEFIVDPNQDMKGGNRYGDCNSKWY